MSSRILSGGNKQTNNCFKDGETKIDFVLVLDKDLKAPGNENLRYITQFMYELQELGIKFEVNKGFIKNNIYVCINLPSRAVQHFAGVYNVNIQNYGHKKNMPVSTPIPHLFNTHLTKHKRDFFVRTSGANSMERIIIASEVLEDVAFDKAENMHGLERLVKNGIIECAYPLHDSDCYYDQEQSDSQLSDRQLLLKYWANLSVWYRKQPLNLIETYYGSEVAFYFAWLGFYNQMLIIAAFIGSCCVVASAIRLFADSHGRVDEVCESKLYICKFCDDYETCELKALNGSCNYARANYVFDNQITVFFSIFMSLWATMFTVLWTRRENEYKARWNVGDTEHDTRVRMAYKKKAVPTGISTFTGKMVYTVKKQQIIVRTVIAYCAYLVMVSVILLSIYAVIVFRIHISKFAAAKRIVRNRFYVLTLSSIVQVIFLKIFELFYLKLAVCLTNLENPRTQAAFDNSVVHKVYFLGFVNNYLPLFYLAFFQGIGFRPSYKKWTVLDLHADVCNSVGCIMGLCIQLFYFMIFKSLIGNIFTLIINAIRKLFKLVKTSDSAPQWENDYKLKPFDRYFLTTEFMEMIIQYGFVTFFVAAFPLAPLCALINNVLELRLDALKFVTRRRRPVPKQQAGIGAWLGILNAITHFGIITNGLVLAFTSDFVKRTLYHYSRSADLDGYINSTLSAFDLKPLNFDFNNSRVHQNTKRLMLDHNVSTCYYKGSRYPPHHPRAYQLTDESTYETGLRLLLVIVFEHVVVVFRTLIVRLIPEIPEHVKILKSHELMLKQEQRLKLLTDKIHDNKLEYDQAPKRKIRKKQE